MAGKVKLNIGVRFDYARFNLNTFRNSNSKIYDETWAITPSIALRPVGTTVIRLNDKYLQTVDLVGNPASKSGIIVFWNFYLFLKSNIIYLQLSGNFRIRIIVTYS